MSLEIEKRFKKFDYKTLRDKFDKLNIIKDGGELFKVSAFVPVKKNQMIRTRNEGNKITFTIKEGTDTYDKEWEVVVSDQEMMDEMLNLLGINRAYSLEKFREKYKYKNSELVFDHYPGLPPYLEIESPNEDELNDLIQKLELKDENFSARDLYYDLYGISKDRENTDLLFNNVLELFEPYIQFNKDKFIKLVQHQKTFIEKYKNK